MLGTGGWVIQPTGQVGLQMVGPDSSRLRTYAQAHEDANGYAGEWNVVAYSVCAPEPDDYVVVSETSPESGSEWLKKAGADCPDGTTPTGAGGGAEYGATGAASLSRLLIDSLHSMESIAIENTSTSADWNAISGQAICG